MQSIEFLTALGGMPAHSQALSAGYEAAVAALVTDPVERELLASRDIDALSAAAGRGSMYCMIIAPH